MEESYDVLNGEQSEINLEINELKPYKDYTMTVHAVNMAGFGLPESVSSMTEIGVAKELVSLIVQKTGTDSTAGLNLIWIAGEKTGPTNYSVRVEEAKSISSSEYLLSSFRTVEGYSTTSFQVSDLIAYWSYQVTVTAVTSAGSGPSKTETLITKSNKPGEVTNFDVELSANDAQVFDLTFECPIEKERNGILKEYIVQKQVQGVSCFTFYSYIG
ncbi:hypothetical protein EGW08_020619, partial [Elysia chlorotica]